MEKSYMIQARAMIESGDDINRKIGPHGNTILHMACDDGDICTVEYLVGHGANANIPNSYGNTPFHYSVYGSPNIEVIKFLLDQGADRYAINNRKQTVIGRALEFCHKDIAQYIESYDFEMTKGVFDG